LRAKYYVQGIAGAASGKTGIGHIFPVEVH